MLHAVSSLHLCFAFTSQKSQMTLKIEKVSAGPRTIIRLSGRLQAEHLDELRAQLDGGGRGTGVDLDLEGVTLVDVEVVRFFITCEEHNVELLHCSPFIREWMMREHH
jgi:anti-anti-sigma regulatory factor